MKNLKLLLLFVLLSSFSHAQSCLPEGIYFSSQNDIDNFQTNNPGCTEIEGNVWIVGGYNITNLNGLSVLTSIGGELEIRYCYVLTSLNGLENLNTIGGTLTIYGTDSITDLVGMENLISIGGDVDFRWNDAVTSLNGLENLTDIGGTLNIEGNNSLMSLDGIENLNSIGGDLKILFNSSLCDCDAYGICNYLSNPAAAISIMGNAEGCNSIIEIAMACGTTLPCDYGQSVTLRSQFDVDYFPAVFNGCSNFGGTLSIDEENIGNLDSLGILSSIGGSLYIGVYGGGNDSLTSLAGLDNLQTIGQFLKIRYNNSLTTLNGLEGLNAVGKSVIIEYNTLSGLNGLDNLTSIGESLEIKNNNSLNDLEGLYSLDSIPGNLSISNNSITSVSGLDTLSYIGGWLGIANNPNLNSFVGLENLTYIGNTLSLDNNYQLTSLNGIDNLESIGGNLVMKDNDNLSECDAVSVCNYLSNPAAAIDIRGNAQGCSSMFEVAMSCGTTIPCDYGYETYLLSQFDVDHFPLVFSGCNEFEGSIRIDGNQIANLDSLIMLNSIGGDLHVGSNHLTNFTGLNNISSISGSLNINNTNYLEGLTGLSSLTIIGNNLILQGLGNANIINFSGLDNLSVIGGDFKITGFHSLESVSELNNVSYIGGAFSFGFTGLTDFDGFANLDTIGGDLSICVWNEGEEFGNDSLISLSGFENLTTVLGMLKVVNNQVLEDISGISNINAESLSGIDFRWNNSLSICNVKVVCDYLSYYPGGDITIDYNAPGCNSQEEVEEACTAFISERSIEPIIIVYPNPASNQINIEYELQQYSNVWISLYDITGRQEVLLHNSDQQKGSHSLNLNMEQVSPGLYLLHMLCSEGSYSRKLIIQ